MGRYLKDCLDVENLARIKGVDLRSENIRRLFEKHGTLELYEGYPEPARVNESKGHDAANLEFPVSPDFISRPPHIDAKVMRRRVEENMPWRSTRPGEQERRLARKVNVEFVL